jgi:parvulin-like peptidyl-prolyl isomerase
MSPPPIPTMTLGQQQPQQNGPGITGQLMQAAMSAMNNPMGRPVPQPQGGIDPSIHPVIAKIIQALAGGADAYGSTAMMPQERMERMQMNQQKAETMARMAQTGEYEAGRIGIGQTNAATNQQNAGTRATDVASKTDYRKFQEQNMEDRLQLATDANNWKQAMASGRLNIAQQMINQKATQFEQKFSLAQKQYGLDAAKVELMGEGMGIKQGMLDLAKTALSQRGTVEGAQAAAKIQQFKIEHPIMSSIMDMSDLDALVGGAAGAGIPGTGAAPTTGAQPAQPTRTAQPAAPKPTKKWNMLTGRYE